MELQNRIGLRVQALRKVRGLTQEGLAERSGKSVDTLSLIERGRILPALDTLYALAEGLGEPVTTLLPDDVGGPEVPPAIAKLREDAWATLCRLDAPFLPVAVALLTALAKVRE